MVGEDPDQPGHLGQRDEPVRRDLAELRVVPAHQRLDADQVAGAQVDLGLVADDDLAGGQRRPQLGDQPEPLQALLLHRRVVHVTRAGRRSWRWTARRRPGASGSRRRRRGPAPAPRRRSPTASMVSPASGYDVETASRSVRGQLGRLARARAPGRPPRTRPRRPGRPSRPPASCGCSRWPTRTSSSSPQVCPSESLTSLNRSRSSWTSATTPSSPAASSIAASRCWPSRARVGSPVSRSWYAACRSRATRSWFSIAAVSRVARLSATCTSSAVYRDIELCRSENSRWPERVRTGAQRDGDDLPGAAGGQRRPPPCGRRAGRRTGCRGPGPRSGRPAPAAAGSTPARRRPR